MTPYYADDWLTVYLGDCRQVMAELPAESVHCVVTSPPYWGLRDYGTATWEGGDEACDHLAGPLVSAKSGLRNDGREHVGPYDGEKAVTAGMPHRDTCRKCGARRIDAQLGLEPTPEAYVESMVAAFREVKRVLRADGTVWLNLGDSYATKPQGHSAEWLERTGGNMGLNSRNRTTHHETQLPPGLAAKQLVGIPWRVAFALQADGWYLRSDIIWSKPNPMPESVTDRPTKAHEYLFLLSKSPRYYFDADAVRERQGNDMNPAGRNLRSVWTIATAPYPGAHFATFPPKLIEPCIKAGCPELGTVLDPFAGSGTTGMVAQSLSRRAVLIDLNAEYLVQTMKRNRDIPLGLGA